LNAKEISEAELIFKGEAVSYDEKLGFFLFSCHNYSKGDIIVEYCGEICEQTQTQKEVFELTKNSVICTDKYCNEARYILSVCSKNKHLANCDFEFRIVGKCVRLFAFATTNI
jgi:hypothetical protein